ncbi:hypothetical protein AWB78_02777 [Caballeronia calidae]|uniref:Uncharacterized protein n=1 Tax=Caballeronia calidae TaxID=1777139 RepID=A0A158BKA6_9BURK|nr:hypothetical protein AWB78_02777 [Caballeronia calidae]
MRPRKNKTGIPEEMPVHPGARVFEAPARPYFVLTSASAALSVLLGRITASSFFSSGM